jgi:transcriptional regulator with XRE-family HTH domain
MKLAQKTWAVMEADAYYRNRRHRMLYNSKETGALIRELRLRKGMSQEVLSGLAEISRSHLSMIETGGKSPNMETLWRISGALELPLSALIRMVEDRLRAKD